MEVANTSADALIMTLATPPYVIVYTNPAWEVLCGWTQAEAYGKTCKILQGAESDHAALFELHMAMLMRQMITVRLVNYKKGGARFINDLTVEPLVAGAHASVTHMLGTLRDRTVLLQTQSQSPLIPAPLPLPPSTPNESEQTRRQLDTRPKTLEAALQPSSESRVITETSRPYRIVHVNKAWCDLCGYSSEEAVGKTCSILQGPGTCAHTLRAIEAACEQQESVACKLLNYTRNGHPFVNMLIISPLVGPDSRTTHLLGTLHPESISGSPAHRWLSGLHQQPALSISASTPACLAAIASTSTSVTACPSCDYDAASAAEAVASHDASVAADDAAAADDAVVQQPKQQRRREPPRPELPPPPQPQLLLPLPPPQQQGLNTGSGSASSAGPAQQPAAAVGMPLSLPTMSTFCLPPQPGPGGSVLPSPELRATQLWVAELLLKQARLQGECCCRACTARCVAEPSHVELAQGHDELRRSFEASTAQHSRQMAAMQQQHAQSLKDMQARLLEAPPPTGGAAGGAVLGSGTVWSQFVI